MAKSKWLQKLRGEEGAVTPGEYNPHAHVLRSPSPFLNFTFGNGHGLPFGYGLVLFGPPKCGKSILCNAFIGQLHKDDPEAIAIKFNTELREEGQFSEIWGIDKERYQPFNRSTPAGIFDFIVNDIDAACQAGEKIKLIVIDSIQGIQGRLSQNAESIEDMRPGDHAFTVQEGLKRITPVLRKHKIALIVTCHIRANLDMFGGGHGPKTKMAGSFGLKHGIEYYMSVKPNTSAEGYKDWFGTPLESQDMTDVKGQKDVTGKRIFVRMDESSTGIDGRTGEFLMDYHRGIVDTWGEIAQVGACTGVVFHPKSKSGDGVNAKAYQFEDQVFNGWDNFLLAVKDSPELQEKIQRAAIAKDLGLVTKQ